MTVRGSHSLSQVSRPLLWSCLVLVLCPTVTGDQPQHDAASGELVVVGSALCAWVLDARSFMYTTEAQSLHSQESLPHHTCPFYANSSAQAGT